MALLGSGSWWLSTFLGPCRLSTSIMPSSQEACIWAKTACTLLVHGQIEELLAAIGQLPKIAPAADESRSVPDKAVDYFTANAQRMRYPAFRAEAHACGQWHC